MVGAIRQLFKCLPTIACQLNRCLARKLHRSSVLYRAWKSGKPENGASGFHDNFKPFDMIHHSREYESERRCRNKNSILENCSTTRMNEVFASFYFRTAIVSIWFALWKILKITVSNRLLASTLSDIAIRVDCWTAATQRRHPETRLVCALCCWWCPCFWPERSASVYDHQVAAIRDAVGERKEKGRFIRTERSNQYLLGPHIADVLKIVRASSTAIGLTLTSATWWRNHQFTESLSSLYTQSRHQHISFHSMTSLFSIGRRKRVKGRQTNFAMRQSRRPQYWWRLYRTCMKHLTLSNRPTARCV